MGFLVGLVLGIAVGVALIVGFARSENSRAARRRQLVSATAPSLPRARRSMRDACMGIVLTN
jgi:hypothetical protein